MKKLTPKSYPTVELKQGINIQELSFEEVNGLIKDINYRSITNSPETRVFGKKLSLWNKELVYELNIRYYEHKLEQKNRKLLSPGCGIPRFKYEYLKEVTSKAIEDIFSGKPNKFENLKLLISTKKVKLCKN